MACAKPNNCAPCSKCPETPQPVMPRCDIVLPDGSYTNATVVVENGCIIDVQQGTAMVYTPDSCCAAPGGEGGGGAGLDGGPGPDGPGATINIGTVTSLAPGSAPTVVNVGTSENAILNIGIPRGEPGDPGDSPTGATVNDAGITFVNGALQNPLPVMWPPVLLVDFEPSPVAGVSLSATKGADGKVMVTVDLTAFKAGIDATLATMQGTIDSLLSRVDALEAANFGAAIADHEARITALEPP